MAVVFSFQQEGGSRYLSFVSRLLGIEQPLSAMYAEVLDHFARDGHLRQLVVALPRYSQGLPDVVLGLWADSRSLNRLVADIHRGLRDERDYRVFQAAVDVFCKERGPDACNPSARQLLDARLLHPESGSTFSRLSVVNGKVQRPTHRDTTISGADADGVTYLAPQLTENDRRYRTELREASLASVKSNRYRLATIVADGALWIATESADLEPFKPLGSEQHRPSLAENVLFRVSGSALATSRAWLFANIDRLIAIGLGSQQKDIEDVARTNLFDLRNHPAVALELSSFPSGQRIRLSGRILHWTAVSAP